MSYTLVYIFVVIQDMKELFSKSYVWHIFVNNYAKNEDFVNMTTDLNIHDSFLQFIDDQF